ncbi:lipid asymmetry maintenance ABC transporter permease subunit MlaE [Massilia endophytica]|uniref:lipid asymmetry maintenance ABC transporter permease subunit MlaE n=1 Tax=Massilia endophytica TaxID=2899220 RepID=UPI001E659618|nr:lipid asymmetry maintenance ABC transporter permease subunit MlaE [Massilia endophytica]UGQ46522.1 lipid asymmetry maintenance ABC transporter permease subunit MlaE [Massilia endophytica]
MLIRPIERLGLAVHTTAREYVEAVGLATRMFFVMLGLSPGLLRRPRLLIEQMHFIGNYSMLIITLSGLFVGMVLGLQGYYTLNKYGAEESLGLLVALGLTRELGPVITALLFAGRAGTSLTAEIGLMKAGEQLSAMEMMAVNPIQRVLAPRFWAGVVSVPVLASIFSAVGVFGGYIVGVKLIGVDEGAFWSQMQNGVDVWKDVFNGFVKSVVFGVAITFISLYQGYEAQPTPEDVAGATTRTVVVSSLMIWWLDFMLTALMFSK